MAFYFYINSVSLSSEFIKCNKEFDAGFEFDTGFEIKLLKNGITFEIYFRIFMLIYF